MSLSGLKDIDREVLKYVDDKELIKFCSFERKTWNEVCDDNFLKRRLSSKYSGIEKYRRENETWKQFYLRAVYTISKMREDYKIFYLSGDFEKQYELLKTYKEGIILLENAADTGQLDLVKYAYEKGVNSSYALMLASENGHLEIVKYLVEQGVTINYHILRRAMLTGHFDIVKYLVEHGADIHALSDFDFKLALEYGYSDIVKYLKNLR